MWNWLRKKSATPSGALETFAKKWLGPQSLTVAIAEAVKDYVDDVQAGVVVYPAHRRESAGVVEIWRDLRLEALHKLFNFGKSDLSLLAEQRRQYEVLSYLLADQPCPQLPQPRGEIVPDTVQALWQVYVYLAEVGSEVADRETDRLTLKHTGRSILDQLTTQAGALRQSWKAFEQALQTTNTALPEMPRTTIEILYEDVTAKAKSIALSATFGPIYEEGIKHLVTRLKEQGGNAQDIEAEIDCVLKAKDPDEFDKK